MRLQKEEKVALVLLLMALSSLIIAAWAIGGLEQSVTAASSAVSIEGKVLELNPTKSGSNLIINLDSIPESIFVPQDSGASEIMSKVRIGDRIVAKGRQTEFQGSQEIRVERAADIKVIETYKE